MATNELRCAFSNAKLIVRQTYLIKFMITFEHICHILITWSLWLICVALAARGRCNLAKGTGTEDPEEGGIPKSPVSSKSLSGGSV